MDNEFRLNADRISIAENESARNFREYMSHFTYSPDLGMTFDEWRDACKMFFDNCTYAADSLSEISSKQLSRIQIAAVVKNDSIEEFIAAEAKNILNEKNKLSI